ncbi:MAG: hypothetical protein J3R72DRAFT_238321, partial [Linnemannia gamsii]
SCLSLHPSFHLCGTFFIPLLWHTFLPLLPISLLFSSRLFFPFFTPHLSPSSYRPNLVFFTLTHTSLHCTQQYTTYSTMTNKTSSNIVECRSQELLNGLIAENRQVVVLRYSHAMPGAKIAEHKFHVCARALEDGSIFIPFALVNLAEFFDDGNKVEVDPAAMIRYTTYREGDELQSTGNCAELEGMITSLM